LQARIVELESSLEQAKNKASKLEKEKSKLTIDIRDFSIQLEEVGTAKNISLRILNKTQ
jgi:hypothetical protein